MHPSRAACLRFSKHSILTVALLMAIPPVTFAEVMYSTVGATYSQNFNVGAPLSNGVDITWTNDSTIPGWFLFRQPSPGIAMTIYRASGGSDTTGSFYSFGDTTVGVGLDPLDRALGGVGSGGTDFGSPASGAIAGWIAVGISNMTGVTLGSFTMAYDGEQWRNGGNTTAQTMVVEYGFGASFTSVASWIAPGAAFDFTGPIATATAGALNGNLPANRTAGLGGTITGLNWLAGSSLWIRFVERNDSGSDHGLAIDNFTFSAEEAPPPPNGVPEPSTLMLGALGLGTLGLVRSRKQKYPAK